SQVGVISDVGAPRSVEKTGAGGLIFSAANTYRGATNVLEGRLLVLAPQAYAGVTTIASGATLALRDLGAIEKSSNVINNGVFDIEGASSDITVQNLSGAGPVRLGGRTLILANGSGTYDGVITGTGGLTKQGSGTLRLTGNQTYVGATTISDGVLALNGELLRSVVTVNRGQLKGSGTTGSVVVNSGGVIAPGNSIGTLSSVGPIVFAPGAIYQVEVDATGASDKVAGALSATLNGQVQVIAAPGVYNANTDYTILTAAGGVSGTFSSVTSNLAYLAPTLVYQGNSVVLRLKNTNIPFQTYAGSLNQVSVATALNNTPSGALYNAILAQTATSAQVAYNALSG
ncbi:MAG: autotransporter outer membrane beta-barrel domain-containing protein, partial [Caulobacteraceae bacterium]